MRFFSFSISICMQSFGGTSLGKLSGHPAQADENKKYKVRDVVMIERRMSKFFFFVGFVMIAIDLDLVMMLERWWIFLSWWRKKFFFISTKSAMLSNEY